MFAVNVTLNLSFNQAVRASSLTLQKTTIQALHKNSDTILISARIAFVVYIYEQSGIMQLAKLTVAK